MSVLKYDHIHFTQMCVACHICDFVSIYSLRIVFVIDQSVGNFFFFWMKENVYNILFVEGTIIFSRNSASIVLMCFAIVCF